MENTPQQDEWKAGINITKPNWTYDVIRICPTLNFPVEFLPLLHSLPFSHFDIEGFITPDGRSLTQWHNDPLSELFQAQVEKTFYHSRYSFPERLQFIQTGVHDEKLCHLPCQCDPEKIIDDFVYYMEELQGELRNKQLMRFLNQWCRHLAQDMANEYSAIRRRMAEHKKELEELADQLPAQMEDEMRPMIWSAEDRQEDRESARRVEELRARFAGQE